jgi:predicted naringenin-chalcone synthase
MSHTTTKVQDIWFKSQRVLRTIVQVGIPAFIAFATVLPSVIDALGLPVDAEVRLWLLAVAAGVTAVAAALSRVMAIPAVNAWLTKIGLGSVPRSAIER